MSETPKVDIRALAALSRIAVTDAEIPKLEAELAGVLAFVEEVQKVEVKTPALHGTGLHNVTRPDTDAYEPGTFTEALLNAAPKRTGDHIEVKQVLAHTKKNKA
jgi:aspartyl-tRNA(Asn)/glutamyl-tRNA(Gln) amidotransferase subunit C